ncbi:hypothetical protein AB0B50_05920 [Streptomyces sp. NPDC041068]|uniref:hypothetical protein n=1 Tax=Streptomyces sp. NPDC041068 TaxID=3155130 RepID=UPI0033DEA93C
MNEEGSRARATSGAGGAGHRPERADGSLHFSMPSNRRTPMLMGAAFFALFSGVSIVVPGPVEGKRLTHALATGSLSVLLVLAYFVFARDFTTADPHGIRIRRLGFLRRSWSWAEVQDVYVERRESVGRRGSSRAVIVVRRDGHRARLTVPGSDDTTSAQFSLESSQLIQYWQRHTGRPPQA